MAKQAQLSAFYANLNFVTSRELSVPKRKNQKEGLWWHFIDIRHSFKGEARRHPRGSRSPIEADVPQLVG